MRTAFYHEDDYCQCEILPVDAKKFCLMQMGKIDDFAEEHRKGPSFTDLYVREDSPHTMRELNLSPEQVEAVLDFLPAYDRVETGYSTYRESCEDTQARGIHEELTVFWSADEGGIVDHIWLDMWVEPEEKNVWERILAAIGRLGPLLLADWGWSRCIDLARADEIEQYIKEKSEWRVE